MNKACTTVISLACGLLTAAAARADSELTNLELKWLHAAEPVLEFANSSGLRVDVVVIPERGADDVPMSMGVRDGRCKLTLSLRGNHDAEATLVGVPVNRHALMIEAMAAHEVAHCWRYTHGAWHTLPAGFVESTAMTDAVDSSDNKEHRLRKNEMRATQREEGYADLVALAWTLREHRESYADVLEWLERIRSDQPLVGSYHDTRPWLSLVKDQAVFPTNDSPFEQVQALWVAGLKN